MAPVALRVFSAVLLAALLASSSAARAEVDPLAAMNGVAAAPVAAAPAVAFKTLEGSEVRLTELRGRPVVLTFFTTW
jgi:cytochrome oxidase Cu insertion factor (SCO1/SenC/PrrC family)